MTTSTHHDDGPPPPSGETATSVAFWTAYRRAEAEAELLVPPRVALTAVVGPLQPALTVAARCRADHWSGDCDVVVLSKRRRVAAAVVDGYRVVHSDAELISAVEDGTELFPLLVIDVPAELPPWVRPLLDRLRQGGLGLVRYALAGDPSDEDLATWHGVIGRPAVLDVTTALAPERVVALLDRGEPIASVNGVAVTPQFVHAVRIEVASSPSRRSAPPPATAS